MDINIRINTDSHKMSMVKICHEIFKVKWPDVHGAVEDIRKITKRLRKQNYEITESVISLAAFEFSRELEEDDPETIIIEFLNRHIKVSFLYKA